MKTLLSQETEEKARKMAETVAKSSSVEIDNLISDDMFLSNGALSYYGIILRSCRRCVIDGFPLEEYFLDEIPCIGIDYVVAYFENINEFGTEKNYNPKAHEKIFVCEEDKNVAVPYSTCNDGRGLYIEQRANCFEAVCLIGG